MVAQVNKVLDSVLKQIKPTLKEKRETELVLQKVKSVAGGIIDDYDLSMTIAGSYVRDTWMRDKKEFDLFVLFPEYYSREDLEKLGLEIGKAIVRKLGGTHKIAYAEHPYVRARVMGYDVDIVPCFKVESAEKIRSAVDRTPFHNQWLNSNLRPRQTGDVRLFKQFCKGQGIYGSDTKVQGLSGYLCELLIVKYKDFESFLRSAAEWKPGTFIDMKGHFSGDRKKFDSDPLVVIDPVDSKRNVAAALSAKNFMKLVIASKEFLDKPSRSFFFNPIGRINLSRIEKELKGRETVMTGIAFKRPDVIDDVLWPQLRKASTRLKNVLEDYEFGVLGRDVWANERTCIILLEFKVSRLPAVRKIRGPEIFREERVKEFRRKYSKLGKVFVEDDRWFAEVKRKFTLAEKKLKETLSCPERELRAKGIPSHVAKSIGRKYSLWDRKKVMSLARKDVGFGSFLLEYLEK